MGNTQMQHTERRRSRQQERKDRQVLRRARQDVGWLLWLIQLGRWAGEAPGQHSQQQRMERRTDGRLPRTCVGRPPDLTWLTGARGFSARTNPGQPSARRQCC